MAGRGTEMTRPRRLAILSLLAAAGAMAFLFLRGDERRDRDPRSAVPHAGEPATPGSANREPSARERVPGRETSTPAETTPPSAPRLRGTIVVVDPDGREHATEDGDLMFMAWSGNTGAGVSAKVDAGRFEVPLPPCDELAVRSIRLADRLATFDVDRIPLPPDGVLALRARWPPPVSLKVVDRRDGRELDRVVVLRATLFEGVGLTYPGADTARDPVVAGAPSPVVLPERAHGGSYWVRAPGYAWHRARVDHSVGGEHVVRLEAGGTLEIRLTDYRTGSKAMVRARRTAGEPEPGRPDVEVAPPATGTVVLEALEPGDYRVSVEIGSWLRRPIVLGSASAAVAAGTTAQVTLRLAQPPPIPERVPLKGTVELHPEWGKLEPDLYLTPLDDDTRALAKHPGSVTCREIEGELRWDAGHVLPGRYGVTIGEPPFSAMLVVGPRGTHDARIVVPQPAAVAVRTADLDTRAPVPVESVVLERLPFPLNGELGRGAATWTEPDENGVFRARIPAGRVRVSVDSPEYVVSDRTARDREIRPGRNEFTVLVTRPSGIRVQFPADADVQEILESTCEIRALDRGGGDSWLWHYGPASRIFVVTKPGSYEVRVRLPGGFKSIAPKVVEVRRARITELAVNLERRE